MHRTVGQVSEPADPTMGLSAHRPHPVLNEGFRSFRCATWLRKMETSTGLSERLVAYQHSPDIDQRGVLQVWGDRLGGLEVSRLTPPATPCSIIRIITYRGISAGCPARNRLSEQGDSRGCDGVAPVDESRAHAVTPSVRRFGLGSPGIHRLSEHRTEGFSGAGGGGGACWFWC